jgi:hypothetical protein
VAILDELGLRGADLGALARDEPERSGPRESVSRTPPGEVDREVPPEGRSRETAGGQVRCPACGFAQTPTSSSCRRCGNRLREPSRETCAAAVLGERDVLAELGLDEADLGELLDRADVPRRRTSPVRDDSRRERVEAGAAWARKLLGYGASAERVADVLRESGRRTEAENVEALRLAEGYGPNDDEGRSGLPSLEEADGLDGWLAARVGRRG